MLTHSFSRGVGCQDSHPGTRPLASALSAALLAFSLAASSPVRGESRPNILFVFTDDHALQAISAYGSRINQTPNIDALAAGGIRFDNCFVTNSICGPARATVLTGKYSHANGMFHNVTRFDPTQPVVTRMLQAAGYTTALIGKWHLQVDPPGFDHYEVLIGQGPYYNPPMIRNGKQVQHTGYTTTVITDLAIQWLQRERDPSKPFYLMYQHKSPHRPWDPPPEYFDLYEDQTIPEPPTLFLPSSGRGAAVRQSDMSIAETLEDRDLKLVPPTELNDRQRKAWEAAYGPRNARFRDAMLSGDALVRWKYQRFIKDYLRCVASLDDNLGRLLKYLDDADLARNTVVFYVSDQGMYIGENGWFDKRWMYDTSLRTPLIVRWPGATPEGTFCDAIVSNVDFAETFLELAGASIPADMHGRSLVPILRGEVPSDWRTVFYYHYYEYPGWHHVRRHYGVTDTRYKLIHFYEEDVDEWELYDVKFDPFEINNLFANPTYAPVRARLAAELKSMRARLAVPQVDPPQSSMGDFPPRTRVKSMLPR